MVCDFLYFTLAYQEEMMNGLGVGVVIRYA